MATYRLCDICGLVELSQNGKLRCNHCQLRVLNKEANAIRYRRIYTPGLELSSRRKYPEYVAPSGEIQRPTWNQLRTTPEQLSLFNALAEIEDVEIEYPVYNMETGGFLYLDIAIPNRHIGIEVGSRSRDTVRRKQWLQAHGWTMFHFANERINYPGQIEKIIKIIMAVST